MVVITQRSPITASGEAKFSFNLDILTLPTTTPAPSHNNPPYQRIASRITNSRNMAVQCGGIRGTPPSWGSPSASRHAPPCSVRNIPPYLFIILTNKVRLSWSCEQYTLLCCYALATKHIGIGILVGWLVSTQLSKKFTMCSFNNTFPVKAYSCLQVCVN